jgi:acetyltransferase-like isoleucine patch superfamily enzyme
VEWLIIGGRSVFNPGVHVGRNSAIGMGSVLTNDVPPETVVMGHPATVRYLREEYETKKKEWNVL